MDEREEIKMRLEQELQWVKYRQNMLDIMDDKLLQMKEIAEKVKWGNFTSEQLQTISNKLSNLAVQVKAIDEESRRMENGNTLE